MSERPKKEKSKSKKPKKDKKSKVSKSKVSAKSKSKVSSKASSSSKVSTNFNINISTKPKEPGKETLKDSPKDISKDLPKEALKEASKKTTSTDPTTVRFVKGVSKEVSKDNFKDIPKVEPKDTLEGSFKGTPNDATKDALMRASDKVPPQVVITTAAPSIGGENAGDLINISGPTRILTKIGGNYSVSGPLIIPQGNAGKVGGTSSLAVLTANTGDNPSNTSLTQGENPEIKKKRKEVKIKKNAFAIGRLVLMLCDVKPDNLSLEDCLELRQIYGILIKVHHDFQ